MRTVFFVSNRTAITAETLARSLLAQFDSLHFQEVMLPYIDSREKATAVVEQIHRTAVNDGVRPIVFSTLIDPGIRQMIVGAEALVLDLFDLFMMPLAEELKVEPLQETGLSHRIADRASYELRIDAINYTLHHDDGASTRHYAQSDVILIGVSRTAKTPTCLYLALQFGLRAANFPITEEDLDKEELPSVLRPYYAKLYGLTTDPERLQSIRTERRPGSRYASPKQCQYEVRAVEDMFCAAQIPFLNTTTMSVEEIATTIVQEAGLHRRGF